MIYKLKKFTWHVSLITFFLLCYVHQNIEVVKLGYAIEKNRTAMNDYLNYRDELMYEICKIKSPDQLNRMVGKDNVILTHPDVNCIRYASSSFSKPNAASTRTQTKNIVFAGLFDILVQEAEAKNLH